MPAPLIKPREGFEEAYHAAIGSAFLTNKNEAGELTITVERDRIVEALLYGIMQLQRKIRREGTIDR